MTELVWRKSSRSGGTGSQCVEVARARRALAVRDSKDPDGPRLTIDGAAWAGLLNEIKRGAYGVR